MSRESQFKKIGAISWAYWAILSLIRRMTRAFCILMINPTDWAIAIRVCGYKIKVTRCRISSVIHIGSTLHGLLVLASLGRPNNSMYIYYWDRVCVDSKCLWRNDATNRSFAFVDSRFGQLLYCDNSDGKPSRLEEIKTWYAPVCVCAHNEYRNTFIRTYRTKRDFIKRLIIIDLIEAARILCRSSAIIGRLDSTRVSYLTITMRLTDRGPFIIENWIVNRSCDGLAHAWLGPISVYKQIKR